MRVDRYPKMRPLANYSSVMLHDAQVDAPVRPAAKTGLQCYYSADETQCAIARLLQNDTDQKTLPVKGKGIPEEEIARRIQIAAPSVNRNMASQVGSEIRTTELRLVDGPKAAPETS